MHALSKSNSPSIQRHRPIQPDLRIFFLGSSQVLAREQHRFINGNGQTSVSTPQHDGAKDELAESMPASAEGIRGIG